MSHPSVAEAAVVGASDATTGQGIVAFVTLRGGVEDGDDLARELRAHVAKEIGPIAKPRQILFTPELPKTRSGKIMRRLLRDVAESRDAGRRHDAGRPDRRRARSAPTPRRTRTTSSAVPRAEVLVVGGPDREPLPWTWRGDRLTRAVGAAVAISLLGGVLAVHDGSVRPAPRRAQVAEVARRVVVRVEDPAEFAEVRVAPEGLEVRPIDGPSIPAARRAAQLIAARQCRNLERPRYRREGGSPDGRTSSYVVARLTDTPRKSAGFMLDLVWHDGGYLARVSAAYGGCASG